MADEDLSEDEYYEKMVSDLEDIITEMKSHMGRFPSTDEVLGFVWGSDSERDDILRKGSVGGS